MSFDRPYALMALALLPLLVGLWFGQERQRAVEAGRFSRSALIPNLISGRPGSRRYVPLGLLLLGLAALIIGAARPHADVSVPRKEATVVLAVDVSRSMLAQDVRPTRLAAAASTAAKFLTTLPKEYSVAVIGIGTRAYVALPPTTDRVLARDALDSLAPSEFLYRLLTGAVVPRPIGWASTVNENGIANLAPFSFFTVVCVIPPMISLTIARNQNGTYSVQFQGGFEEQIRVPPSPGTLQQIARLSGGRFYHARTTAALEQVYKSLATRTGHKTQSRQISDLFAGGAIVLLLAGGGLSAFWFRRAVP